MPCPTGLAKRDILMLDIAYLSDGCLALKLYHADFAGGQSYLALCAFFSH